MNGHRCPVVGCYKRTASGKLMCLAHWRLLPRDLQDAVYTAFYRGPGSPEHIRAMAAAIRAVNATVHP